MSSSLQALQALRQEADALHQTYAAEHQRYQQLMKQWNNGVEQALTLASPREKLDIFIYMLPYGIWGLHKLVDKNALALQLRTEAEAVYGGIIPYFERRMDFAVALINNPDPLVRFFLVRNMSVLNHGRNPRIDVKADVLHYPALVEFINKVNKTGIFGESDITY